MYRLIYKVNHDPTAGMRARNDVRASLTVGRTTFHDGYGWGPFLGNFTGRTGRGGAHCLVKLIVLPNDPAFAPGATFRGTLNFSRTRQRIPIAATINTGTVLATTPADMDPPRTIGCTYARSTLPPHREFMGGPTSISPASLVVPIKRKTSANGQR